MKSRQTNIEISLGRQGRVTGHAPPQAAVGNLDLPDFLTIVQILLV